MEPALNELKAPVFSAYWWKGQGYKNLGDELARIIPERLFGMKIEHSGLSEATLLSVGSVLGWVWDSDLSRKNNSPLHVVGSGFMSFDTRPQPLDFVKIHSVRGHLSKNMLGKEDSWGVGVGDPGILASRIVKKRQDAPKYPIGVVLHHKKSEDVGVMEKLGHLPVRFIDIRTDDIDLFCKEIQECEIVLSQSLHGLIIADSFGIPNAWLFLGNLHSGGDFKFFDYFSTIDRTFDKKVRGFPKSIDDILKNVFISNEQRVSRLQDEVVSSYRSMLTEF